MKSDNISYRYDEEKMAFLLEKEQIGNPRRALDFLLDKYWWEHRNGFINTKPPSQDFSGRIEKESKQVIASIKKPTIIRSPEQWLELKRSCESVQEWNEVKSELMAAENIPTKTKQIIINTP
jgi:hypothetical protein